VRTKWRTTGGGTGWTPYLAIKVTEKEYGPEFARGVLKFFQERYFTVHRNRVGEVPLTLAGEGQDFLNYRKSALAYHAMSCYLGEENFHNILADFERKYRFAPPPFATSLDLVEALRRETPDSLQYLITDYFETITLYDNRLEDVVMEAAIGGGSKVSFDLQVVKYRVEGNGKRTYQDEANQSIEAKDLTSLPLADYIEVGFYTGERLLGLKQLRVTEINTRYDFTLDEKPDRIVLDPNYLLLDGERADGVWSE